MDSRRAETLEALSAYLQHQKNLLARTQADIERLKRLRAKALTSPEQLANNCNFQGKNQSTSQLIRIEENVSDLQDYHPAQSFPARIDWEAFSACDTTPLRTLSIRSRIDHTQRTIPSNTQCSPLSYLQKFVKDARKIIIDPVFESLLSPTNIVACSNPTTASNPHVNSPSNDPNHVPTLTILPVPSEHHEDIKHTPVAQESNATPRKRELSRANTRNLKNRRIKCDLAVGCRLGEEGTRDVFTQHDIEDENADVDMIREVSQSRLSMELDRPLLQFSDSMDLDTTSTVNLEDATRHAKPPNLSMTRQPTLPSRDSTNSLHSRQASLKPRTQSLTALTELKNEPSPASILPISSQTLGKRCRDVSEINEVARKTKTEPLSVSEVNAQMDKNRSETYKQAWSISEQHLLERLLEEIPEGERNRWAKISQAMGGRRTPRQVASRVQKYFEKLKRFGVGVESKGKAKS